jgi:hypothetical protein
MGWTWNGTSLVQDTPTGVPLPATTALPNPVYPNGPRGSRGGWGWQKPGTPPPADKLQPEPQPAPDFNQEQPGIGESGASAVASALFTQPGFSEQQFAQNKGAWNAPTNTQGYWQGIAGQFNGGNMANSRAASAYDQYMKNMPQIAPEANLGGFYDNARTRQAQDMNAQLGARGAFNSSAALDKLAQGQATLNAQQVSDEAKYSIDRASTMGSLYNTLGTLGNQADSQRNDWLKTGGALASKADEMGLAKLEGGARAAEGADSGRVARLSTAATAALGAQGARDERIQGAFNNINKLGDQLGGVVTDAYTKLFTGDQALMDAALSGDIARVAEALNISNEQANRIATDLKSVAEVAASVSGKKG